MQEIIDSIKEYNYGYCEYINKINLVEIKSQSRYYECSVPDEIFDTENYTLIDKTLKIKKLIRPFMVKERDNLFWTFYILNNGIEMYTELGVKNLIVEKKEKLSLIDNVIQKNIQLLKDYKIRITKGIIQSLAYDKNISFQTFQVLCILHNITFIIQYKKCYYECKHPKTELNSVPFICILNESNELSICFDKDSNKIDEFRNENIDITSIIGFSCYYTWKGMKKKIPKSFSEYTHEINALNNLFTIKE